MLPKATLLLTMLLVIAGRVQAQPVAQTPEPNSSGQRETNARLVAFPNPAPAGNGSGTTRITWNTGDGSEGRVYVAEDGGAEKLFARGRDGNADASWIAQGVAYEFRLYSETKPETVLATVRVTGDDKLRDSLELAPLLLRNFRPAKLAPLVATLLLFSLASVASRKGREQLAVKLFIITLICAVSVALVPLLSVESRALAEQPFPDAQESADAARQLVSGNGYVTYIHNNERHPPRYPPGFSLALAPFAAISQDFPSNVQWGAKFFAVLYVLACVAAAWRLGGTQAATLASLLIAVSPFARVASTLVMSDALAAGGTVSLVVLLHRLTPLRVSLAGALAGALVAVRLPMMLNLVALLCALPNEWRKRLALFAAPPVGLLSLWQWATFGNPFKTGYNYWLPHLQPFKLTNALTIPTQGDGPWIYADVLGGWHMQWLCPCPLGGAQSALANVLFYPAALLGFFWVYAPPFVTSLGLLYAWLKRGDTAAGFTLWLTALSFIFFCFYFHQGIRFMAAPASLLLVYASVMLASLCRRLFGSTPRQPAAGACEAVIETTAETS